MHIELVTVSSPDSGPVQLCVAARSSRMLQEAGFLSDPKVECSQQTAVLPLKVPGMSAD